MMSNLESRLGQGYGEKQQKGYEGALSWLNKKHSASAPPPAPAPAQQQRMLSNGEYNRMQKKSAEGTLHKEAGLASFIGKNLIRGKNILKTHGQKGVKGFSSPSGKALSASVDLIPSAAVGGYYYADEMDRTDGNVGKSLIKGVMNAGVASPFLYRHGLGQTFKALKKGKDPLSPFAKYLAAPVGIKIAVPHVMNTLENVDKGSGNARYAAANISNSGAALTEVLDTVKKMQNTPTTPDSFVGMLTNSMGDLAENTKGIGNLGNTLSRTIDTTLPELTNRIVAAAQDPRKRNIALMMLAASIGTGLAYKAVTKPAAPKHYYGVSPR